MTCRTEFSTVAHRPAECLQTSVPSPRLLILWSDAVQRVDMVYPWGWKWWMCSLPLAQGWFMSKNRSCFTAKHSNCVAHRTIGLMLQRKSGLSLKFYGLDICEYSSMFLCCIWSWWLHEYVTYFRSVSHALIGRFHSFHISDALIKIIWILICLFTERDMRVILSLTFGLFLYFSDIKAERMFHT
jgi:hypothetical protein